MTLTCIANSATQPPSHERLEWFEDAFRVKLPPEFLELLNSCNGGTPTKRVFEVQGNERLIEQFLCLVDNPKEHRLGGYDITVVMTQIDDRLGTEDEVGAKLVPFAALFGGDFLVLDFRSNPESPSVGIWDHNQSEEFKPFVIPVAETLGAL